MKPSKGSRQLRKGRYDAAKHYYSLTTTTHQRQPLLASPVAAQAVLAAIHWMDENQFVGIEAGVVMPDHIHIVIVRKNKTLPSVMRSLKGYSARQINVALKRSGKVWQTGYHDHAIRKDEDLNAILLYCLENPVRAGLVTDFHDYPYWCCKYSV